MKFCVKCGHKFTEDELFCPNCGQKRDALPGPEEMQVESTNSNVVDVISNTDTKNETEEKSKKSKGKLWLVLLIILIVLAIAGVALWKFGVFDSIFNKESSTEETNTENVVGPTDSANPITDDNVDDIPVNVRPVQAEDKDVTCMIHNAELADKVVTAKVSSTDEAVLVAEIYSEDLKNVLDSQTLSVPSNADSQKFELELSKDIPEKYALKVSLKNSAGEELCAPFIDVSNTTAYAEMLAKTTADFPADRTLVVESGENGGFFVIAQDTLILKNGENVKFKEYNQDSEILVLEGVSAEISKGQKLVLLNDGDIEACVTVKDIRKSGEKTTIIGDFNDALTDYFDFFRLELEVTEDMMDQDYSDNNFTTLNNADNQEYLVQKLKSDDIGGITPTVKSFKFDSDGKLNFAGDMNISGGITGDACIIFKAFWDKDFLPDNTYFDMGMDFVMTPLINLDLGYGHDFDGTYEDEKTAESSWKNGIHISLSHVGFNLGDAKWKWLKKIGDNFAFNSDFALEITGSLSGTVGMEVSTWIYMGAGLRVVKGSWVIPKADPYFNFEIEDTEFNFNAKAKGEIFAGLKYEGSVKLAKLVELKLTARAGAVASLEIEANSDPILTKHACMLCFNGEGRPVTDIDFVGGLKTSWNIFDKKDDENVEANMLKFHDEIPYDDLTISGYASLVHDPAAEGCFEDFPAYFGFKKKTCPNVLTKVEFIALDKDSKEISVEVSAVRSDGLWSAEKGSKNKVVTDTADNNSCLYPGTYTAEAEYEGKKVSVEFTVPDETSVTLSFVDDEVKNNGRPVVGFGPEVFYFENTKDTYEKTGIMGYFSSVYNAKNRVIRLNQDNKWDIGSFQASGNIFIWNENLYFANSANNWYSCNLDGTEVLAESIRGIQGASAHPNILIYTNSDYKPFILNASGKKVALKDSTFFLGFHEDSAYFAVLGSKNVSYYRYAEDDDELSFIGAVDLVIDSGMSGSHQGGAVFEEDGIYVTAGSMGGTGMFYSHGGLYRVDYNEGIETLIASKDDKYSLDFNDIYILHDEDGNRRLYFGHGAYYSNVGSGFAANISENVYYIDLDSKNISKTSGFTLCKKMGQFLKDGDIKAYIDNSGVPVTIMTKDELDNLGYTNLGYSGSTSSDSLTLDIIDNYAYICLRQITVDDSASLGWRQGYRLSRMGLYRINLKDASEGCTKLYEFSN